MNKMNENGRSMVEMLGVLAIIGVLSAGGLAGYSKAMYKYRVNETMNQLTMIVSNIRTLFGSQSTYTGLSNDHALTYGIVTPDMLKNNTLQNPFKGSIYINSAAGRKANDDEAFIIEYNGLPAEACVTMVTSDWGASAGSGLIGIAADGDCGSSGTAGGCAASKGTVNYKHQYDANAGKEDAAEDLKDTALKNVLITASRSEPFTIAAAVAACNPSTDGGDTSQNASVALKYY